MHQNRLVSTSLPLAKKLFKSPDMTIYGEFNGKAFYCVEWSNDPDTQNCPTKFTTSRKEALDLAEKQYKNFRCVWISELGEYYNKNRNVRNDWMYFWWSKETFWGNLPPQGCAVPESHNYAVEYRQLKPFDPSDL
jgi:hypothetical protein